MRKFGLMFGPLTSSTTSFSFLLRSDCRFVPLGFIMGSFVMLHLLTRLLGLCIAGVYKRQEARLMLLRYQMRALAHSSLSRITDESWAMDGFVSLLRNLCSWSEIKWKQHLSIFLFDFVLFLGGGGVTYLSVNNEDVVIVVMWWCSF